MNLGRGTSYVHTVETAADIKSLNSTSQPRHLHFMCKVWDISSWYFVDQQPSTSFGKVNRPAIISSHVFDQTSISGPLNSNSHSLISLCSHDTIWSKAHRHVHVYFPHMMNIVKWQAEATSTSKTVGRTSATSSTSTLTTNIMHSKGATVTINYNDDIMEMD